MVGHNSAVHNELSKETQRYDSSFNPFNIAKHNTRNKSLRRVTSDMVVKLKMVKLALSPDLKIYEVCRKKFFKDATANDSLPETSSAADNPEKVPSESDTGDSSSITFSNLGITVSKLNENLAILGDSPIKKTKLSQVQYPHKKLKRIEISLKEKLFNVEEGSSTDEKSTDSFNIIQKLIDTYHATYDKTLKLQILTIFEELPHKKIQQHFDASMYMITKAKSLLQKKGIL